MEKEQSFKDASKNYELAWKYGNKCNPAIGTNRNYYSLSSINIVGGLHYEDESKHMKNNLFILS